MAAEVRPGRMTLIALAVSALVADQLSKFAVEKYIAPGSQRVVVPGVLNLLHTTNPGVAFGLFAGSASPWKPLLLVGFSVVVIGLLIWLLITDRAGRERCRFRFALLRAPFRRARRPRHRLDARCPGTVLGQAAQ